MKIRNKHDFSFLEHGFWGYLYCELKIVLIDKLWSNIHPDDEKILIFELLGSEINVYMIAMRTFSNFLSACASSSVVPNKNKKLYAFQFLPYNLQTSIIDTYSHLFPLYRFLFFFVFAQIPVYTSVNIFTCQLHIYQLHLHQPTRVHAINSGTNYVYTTTPRYKYFSST